LNWKPDFDINFVSFPPHFSWLFKGLSDIFWIASMVFPHFAQLYSYMGMWFL